MAQTAKEQRVGLQVVEGFLPGGTGEDISW